MKFHKSIAVGLVIASALMASSTTWAGRSHWRGHGHGHGHGHHGGARVGITIGASLLALPLHGYSSFGYRHGPYGSTGLYGSPGVYGAPGYHGVPGYYGPATTVITAPLAPPVYIEQKSASAARGGADGYWYYCQNPDGYYPYVRQCNDAWQQVLPQPADR